MGISLRAAPRFEKANPAPMILFGNLFSAKGATFIGSLGQRPRDLSHVQIAALTARFIPERSGSYLSLNRWDESRLQRLFASQSKPWGDAPGWRDDAPVPVPPGFV